MVKVIGNCVGYVEQRSLMRFVTCLFSVSIKPSSMYLPKINNPVVSLSQKHSAAELIHSAAG